MGVTNKLLKMFKIGLIKAVGLAHNHQSHANHFLISNLFVVRIKSIQLLGFCV
jgi:hypothetical protein